MAKRKKNNEWLAKQQAKKLHENRIRWFISQTFLEDCMIIAINRVFHRKGGIIMELLREFHEIYAEMAVILIDDGEHDEEMWYTKEKMDRELRDIMGEENFVPWDVRYDYSRKINGG